ncbi:transcription factor bHLH120-like [Syzygium oleosum]|uniref:transcription factor bHLH120-like n=1 Tax=Syzygium oleosum TaxID=219896 RepID=UPI0011D24746|nr:transcription factor bHLH120-like [Syzygium oleosum]
MSYFTTTIPFDQTDEFFQCPSFDSHQQHHQVDDYDDILCQLSSPPDGNFFMGETLDDHDRQGNKMSSAFDKSMAGVKPNVNTNKNKKVIHRDIERQRRQEMATLYGSLRKQLPIEFLKGKRSISDHIHETVNFIRHMQNKIQALSDKRDELKGLSDSGAPTDAPECSRNACSRDDTVMVQPCMAGVEILINTASQQGLPLSRAFKALSEEGVNVISCNSMQVSDRILHSIKAEVTNGGNSNMSELQQKLMKLTT